MEPCYQLLILMFLLSMAFGTAWAQEENYDSESTDDSSYSSNIDSWDEDAGNTQTWFGMGFEMRESAPETPGRQKNDRFVNNW